MASFGRGRCPGIVVGVVACALAGCGGVHVGPDPEGPADVAEQDRTEIPESGYADWPDETLPLVTVERERPRAPADDASSEGVADEDAGEDPERSRD